MEGQFMMVIVVQVYHISWWRDNSPNQPLAWPHGYHIHSLVLALVPMFITQFMLVVSYKLVCYVNSFI